MEFATGALGTLLPKLAQLLQDEYNLHKNAKKDIQFLSRELETMRAALRNVGEVPPEQLSELVRIWVRDVRELSYDMEDIVDTFLVRVQGPDLPSKKSTKRFFKKMTRMVAKATARRGIAQEIKDIKDRVKEVAERRDRYNVDGITPATSTLVDRRITALYTKPTDLVGIDEPREELIMRLTKEEDGTFAEQRMVSIVGYGGLGKTTLAKAVYDKLRVQFDCSAFVSVSRNPDMTRVFKDMLYDLDKIKFTNIHSTTMGQKLLMDLVQEFLQNKRYLIVVDDLWDPEQWEIIQCALPENGMKSRVITTTRRYDVAQHVGGCYKLKCLTHKSSKILFYGRIFGSEGNCPQQFLDVSEKILNKCGGVPLAIVTTSSLLANKSRSIKERYDVCDSIGSELGKNPGIDSMRKILLLSYYDLTPHLKTCLLYLCVFPEDYVIERERLIFRWIAEGIIQNGEGSQSLLEIGQSYFNELLNRSLIQPSNLDQDDTSPFLCQVHDITLDLICSLSREESFASTISGDCKHITSSSEGKVRRLTLHNTTSWPAMNTSQLRSITIISSARINSFPTPGSCYNLLRVFDLEDCNLRNHQSIEFVGKLFHLRYLSLAGTGYAGKVSPEIGRLQFLQTLNLNRTDIKKLPSSVIGLRKLMVLAVGYSTRLPDGIRNLSTLELLKMNVDSAYIAEELGHLTQLRRLAVNLKMDNEGRWDESMCEVLVSSLGKLHKIQTLAVVSDDMAIDLEAGSVESLCSLCHLLIAETRSLPAWIDPASFLLLSLLYIEVVQVQREDIQRLGELQALRDLRMKVVGDTQVFERFMISADAFPCVTRCRFTGFSTLPSMFPPGAMHRLQRFKFDIRLEDFCGGEFIAEEDLALGHLPSVENVRAWIFQHGEEETNRQHEVVMKVKEALRQQRHIHLKHPDVYICTDDVYWIQL
ncbi:hypothetical protein BS78_K275600 [Paspalum vaginatum]|uniref:Uncharacterized protein n=1 Tax=Paspalum vaginatum TaxID=158149 RepID=A0A9W8CGI6_9POAL|nr:hypothetical protein BS78_K275600 [Paspalum vaginatum]